MTPNAKAVIVKRKRMLFLPHQDGGRQQFSCRCSRRSMCHWNPPGRKTEIETSKRLQTPRRSRSNLTSPITEVKYLQIRDR